ncbi:ribonuclease domain-containing protein [Novilysobacter spongiicola]|uniref:Guanyl-specific ribonuclease Sa n=1 Tax=Lysobacter spongiicola DSM 21749 TaxID=1122188 RepID=A0A1T4Q3U6_9GAMM|nr:ribonuclease domain-containing protein [Lysobacter spongiicola]SJZ98440.1 Guanyl-specific ribonuclease Sa [Lysobacter spongiicola DSM 21749]
MRRKHYFWLLAAIVVVVLWFWTRPADDGTLDAPPAPVETPADAATSDGPGSPGAGGSPSSGSGSGSGPTTSSGSAIPGTVPAPAPPPGSRSADYPAFLPAEAHPVLDDIAHGGPFEYRQDGSVFHNREGLLPERGRGYYREFTVPTPGSDDRGARRIVIGGDPPEVYFYTDDHYASFRRFDIPRVSR